MPVVPESYITNTPDQSRLDAHARFEELVKDDPDLALRAFAGYTERSELQGAIGRAIGIIANFFDTKADQFTHYKPLLYTAEIAAQEETWHARDLATKPDPAATERAKTALRRTIVRTYLQSRATQS